MDEDWQIPCPDKECECVRCSHRIQVFDNPYENQHGEAVYRAKCTHLSPSELFEIPATEFDEHLRNIYTKPVPTARTDSASATVEDIQRAAEEVKLTVRKAKREIIKDAHTARTSEADRRVPKGERGRQIGNVRKIMREAKAAGKRMSILRACRAVWQDVKGGYPSPEALYAYCHSHKTEF